MTNTELAIQKAVEGGWGLEQGNASKFISAGERNAYFEINSVGKTFCNLERIWLDPEFFKALGKNLGWGATKNFSGRKKDSLLDLWPEEWQVYQHLLIDAIQQGRSINEFFGEILKK